MGGAPKGRMVRRGWVEVDRRLRLRTPDRADLVAASLPAAADHMVIQYRREEDDLKRRLAEVKRRYGQPDPRP